MSKNLKLIEIHKAIKKNALVKLNKAKDNWYVNYFY